jgi:hypothetical protein
MQGMAATYLWATGDYTASWEFNVPGNYYVIAQCGLNMFINTTGSSSINIVSYTLSDGTIINLDYPNQLPAVWGQGILSVTFALYAYGSFSTGVADVFLW